MPNDAISREGAIEAVRDLFDTHGKWTSSAMIHQALASLPADTDVPKRPPMLLASIGDCSRDVWWTRQGEDLWESQRIFGVATHSSSAGLLVSRDHSDPEALRLYLEDMAEAQD